MPHSAGANPLASWCRHHAGLQLHLPVQIITRGGWQMSWPGWAARHQRSNWQRRGSAL